MVDVSEKEGSKSVYETILPRPYTEGMSSGGNNNNNAGSNPSWPPQNVVEDVTSLNPDKVSRETFGQPDGQRAQLNPIYGTRTDRDAELERKLNKPNVAVISIPLQDHPKPTIYPRPPTPPPILRANNKGGGQHRNGAFQWPESLSPSEEYQEAVMDNGGVLQTETDVDTLNLSKKNGAATSNGGNKPKTGIMKKNVSWNERVQFQTEMAADLGTRGPEGLTQDNVNIQLVRQTEGEERLQEPNGHIPLSHQPAPSKSSGKLANNPHFKTYMCVAVILLIFAIGGLLALGSLYAIKYIESDDPADDIKELTKDMELQAPSFTSPFREAWHTDPDIWEEEGIIHYLAESGDNMTWFQPTPSINMMWHKGSPLKVHSLSPSDGYITAILGDPVDTSRASFSLHMKTDTWYAGELLDSGSYCVVSIMKTSESDFDLSSGKTSDLLKEYPNGMESVIRKFAADKNN